MSKPIAVVGSINMDLVVASARLPLPGETLIGRSLHHFHGGKGANQAVAAARLGYPVLMVGAVGDDSSGPSLRSALRSSGVDTQAVQTVPGASGTALITTAEGGDNSIIVVPGANAHLTVDCLEGCAAELKRAGMLLAQLEIPMDSIEWLARFAEREDIPLMLDPAPASSLPSDIVRRVTWLTPNETEAATLVGEHGSPEEVADALTGQGATNIVLKLGKRGCLVAQAGAPKLSVPGFDVEAVDTTAAGDGFNAAFAVALMRGRNTLLAATYANAVAALSVTKAGAQPSMPAHDDVINFLEEADRQAA